MTSFEMGGVSLCFNRLMLLTYHYHCAQLKESTAVTTARVRFAFRLTYKPLADHLMFEMDPAVDCLGPVRVSVVDDFI